MERFEIGKRYRATFESDEKGFIEVTGRDDRYIYYTMVQTGWELKSKYKEMQGSEMLMHDVWIFATGEVGTAQNMIRFGTDDDYVYVRGTEETIAIELKPYKVDMDAFARIPRRPADSYEAPIGKVGINKLLGMIKRYGW